MIDPFGRTISYLRLSVTDRCDLRCIYCMPERMAFLPRADLLSLAELDRLAAAFIRKGVRKLRLTGGEPLVRRDFMDLVGSLSRFLGDGALEELTLTTNGTRLARHAADLARCGVRRINVSLDSLDPGPTPHHRAAASRRRRRHLCRLAPASREVTAVALRHDNLPGLVTRPRAHARGAELRSSRSCRWGRSKRTASTSSCR